MSELHRKLGELLAIERKRQQLKLDDIASELKMPTSNLEYVESGDTSKLPSEIYFDLFAKSYATLLGIDFDATKQAIKEELGISLEPGDDTRPAPERPDQKPTKITPNEAPATDTSTEGSGLFKKLAYMMGGLVLLLIAFVLVNRFLLGEDAEPDSSAIANETITEEIASSPDDRAEPELFTDFIWGTPPDTSPDSIRLTLRARGESWATVITDGDTAFYNTLKANQVRNIGARYRMLVLVGVPSQVDIELSGQSVDLRNARGRISRAEVTQLNLADLLAGKRIWEVSTSRLETEGQDVTTKTVTRQTQPTDPPTPTPTSDGVNETAGSEIDTASGGDDTQGVQL